jgi:hypothetical protein
MTTAAEIHVVVGPEELAVLFAEIRRYLDAVDAFRLEGHQPSWRPETQTEVLR